MKIFAWNFEKVLSRYPDVTLKVLKAVAQPSQEVIKRLSVYTVE